MGVVVWAIVAGSLVAAAAAVIAAVYVAPPVRALPCAPYMYPSVHLATTRAMDLRAPVSLIDGMWSQPGMRILVKDQPSLQENGIYEIDKQFGLTLAPDFRVMRPGALVWVTRGQLYAHTTWTLRVQAWTHQAQGADVEFVREFLPDVKLPAARRAPVQRVTGGQLRPPRAGGSPAEGRLPAEYWCRVSSATGWTRVRVLVFKDRWMCDPTSVVTHGEGAPLIDGNLKLRSDDEVSVEWQKC